MLGLRLRNRIAPFALLEVNLRPFGLPEFAGPHKQQRRQLEAQRVRQARTRPNASRESHLG
jgi:hypothetical protein